MRENLKQLILKVRDGKFKEIRLLPEEYDSLEESLREELAIKFGADDIRCLPFLRKDIKEEHFLLKGIPIICQQNI